MGLRMAVATQVCLSRGELFAILGALSCPRRLKPVFILHVVAHPVGSLGDGFEVSAGLGHALGGCSSTFLSWAVPAFARLHGVGLLALA